MKLVLSIILGICTLLPYHDYHFSFTEVDYNKDNSSLETSIKVFTDDLDKALSEIKGEEIRLNTVKEHEDASLYINQYLNKFLEFEVNGKQKPYDFIGYEHKDDATWLYVEVPKVKRIKEFKLKNALLVTTYDDQKNTVSINLGTKKKGFILSKRKDTCKMKL